MKFSERDAYVAFNLTEQVGSVTVGELVAYHDSAAAAWEQYPNKISRSGGEVDVADEYRKAKRFGVKIITPVDAEYPETLRKTPGHPLALYVKGAVEALSKPAIAIIGTRRATPYGLDQAHQFAADLAASGWSIVSGLALGIDAEAHKGALAAGGITVGVLGSALDRFYPEENRELAREIVKSGGAVVSEFPFGRGPDTQTFPQRNHVVAALANGVVAVEAPLKSGTLITTTIAANIGRTVMALPGRVDSRASAGCLSIIRDGARMVRSARDVEEEMGDLFAATEHAPRKGAATRRRKPAAGAAEAPRGAGEGAAELPLTAEDGGAAEMPRSASAAGAAEMPRPKYSVEEAMVMKFVDVEGISIDELVRKTKLPVAKVNAVTMSLRIKGRLRYFPGNRVALPRAK